jgi:hypothetical protein
MGTLIERDRGLIDRIGIGQLLCPHLSKNILPPHLPSPRTILIFPYESGKVELFVPVVPESNPLIKPITSSNPAFAPSNELRRPSRQVAPVPRFAPVAQKVSIMRTPSLRSLSKISPCRNAARTVRARN